MKLTLYVAAGSSSLASQIALEESGARYDTQAVLLAEGEQRGEPFRALNPLGRVPVLVVDDQVITETVAILSYVASRYPEAALLPLHEPRLLARAYQWMAWYATTVHVAIAQIWRTERFTPLQEVWPAVQEGGVTIVKKSFGEIENSLLGPWILGDRYSVLDGYTAVMWRWAQRLNLDLTQYPRWAAQQERLRARPAVARAYETERRAHAIRQDRSSE